MTRDEIYARLRDLLAQRFEVDPERITPTTRLFQDLDLDSIDAIDMAVELQEWTGRRLPEEALRAVRTVDDVVSMVASHLAEGGATSGPPPGGFKTAGK
ncbi:MAG: acyl carrier protein [Polyangia bacterium]